MFPLRPRRDTAAQPALDRQLGALVEEHSQAVYQLAYGILHDRGLAEDVVQETMIKAWRSLGGFRGDSSVRTWVLRIAHHTAIDVLRRRRDAAVAPADLPETEGARSDDPQARAAARAQVVALREALGTLDDTSRSVVLLREVEGLSYQQIADTLELSVPVVKTRLLRARRRLQQAVEGREGDENDTHDDGDEP